MTTLLAPAHLALTIIILIWDIVLAGRIAQNRRAPRAFQGIAGMAALLVLPALLLHLATSTVVTGRSVATMDWVWPAVLVLFAVQAVYALVRRLVNLLWGVPIVVYDLLIATIGVTRYLVAHGYATVNPLVPLLGAQTMAMVFVLGSPSVVAMPFYLNMPMVSPAFPALRKLTAAFRAFMVLIAVLWCLFILVLGMPRAIVQQRYYDAHRRDQLRERPNADFAIGLKMYPNISGAPAGSAIRADSAVADTLDPDVINVVVTPSATRAALDSLARLVGPARRDSGTVIVTIGYDTKLLPTFNRQPLDVARRLATLKQVVTKLHPNIVIPAEDPYGSGQRAFGRLAPAEWESFLTQAASVAKSVDRRVRVGVAASAYTSNDSALFAWAAASGSPIDVVGFSLFPSPYLGGGIPADTRTADRWLRAAPPHKELWVFAVGGFPLAYGENNQAEAVWEVLAWATDHPSIRGAVIYEAGDYGQARGLRAPNGRYRPAARSALTAIRQIRESAR